MRDETSDKRRVFSSLLLLFVLSIHTWLGAVFSGGASVRLEGRRKEGKEGRKDSMRTEGRRIGEEGQ
jgi:hypothetical protein